MLLEALTDKLDSCFPSLSYTVDPEDRVITVPEKHPDVGTINIKDDKVELTVFVGKFTHCHEVWYEEDYTVDEIIEAITDQTMCLLEEIFTDPIVMYGSHEDGGAFIIGMHLLDWLK